MRKLLLIGPCGKGIGGISTTVRFLNLNLPKHNIQISNICADKTIFRFLRPIESVIILCKIVTKIILLKPRYALLFSSAQESFWEKSIFGYVLAKLGVIPYMVMVAGDFPSYHDSLKPIYRKIAQFLVGNIEIVAQSKTWATYYSKIFYKHNVPIITGGVDVEFFKPMAKKKNNQVNLLYVGWLIEDKGIYDLIDSIYILRKSNKSLDIKLKLIGPLHEGIEKINLMICEYELKNIINVIGPVYCRDELRGYYQSSDIFILPSHFEGFPCALLEAISSGLACIATNVGGIPDILDNGRCGTIIHEKDSRQLSDAIYEMIEDIDKMQKLKILSRNRAISLYSLEQSAFSYASIFME